MTVSTIFSCLFAEDLEYLQSYITNFLNFTDKNCALIVNCSNHDDISALGSIDDRVHIHSGSTQRSKVGPTLLLGHLENFAVARETFGAFRYFCTTASNALFVNRLRGDIVPELMTHHGGDDAFDIDHLPAAWHWPEVERDPIFLDYVRSIGLTAIRSSQIEGLCAAREDWDHVAGHHVFLDQAAQRGLQTFPYEEVFPITILMGQASGRFGILCHNFWDRFTTSAGAARFDDLVQPLVDFEQPLRTWGSNRVFAMKWFPRDPRNPITALLCQPNAPVHLDALRDVLIRRSDDPIKFFYKEIAHKYLVDTDEIDLFSPINIFLVSNQQERTIIYRNAALQPSRQIDYLSSLSGPVHRSHLYLEESDGRYDVELTIGSSGSDYVLRTMCKRLNGACDRAIIAYLYIPCRSLVSGTLLVSARISADDGSKHGEAERLTYFYNDTYAVMERDGETVHAETELGAPVTSFRIDLPSEPTHGDGPCYIGIPVVADVNMSFRIRIYRARPPWRNRGR
jgi:hypothetical protein